MEAAIDSRAGARGRKTAVKGNKQYGRSKISNGDGLLPKVNGKAVDGRSTIYRRYRDIVSAIASDFGGIEHMSEARLQLCRRFAAAACLAEEMEAQLANGEQINLTEFSLLSSTLCRLSSRIGINRIPKNVTPNVADYIDAVAAQEVRQREQTLADDAATLVQQIDIEDEEMAE